MTANHNYHNILIPISIGINGAIGNHYNVQIYHVLIQNEDESYATTGIFNLYIDNFGLDKNEFDDLTDHELFVLTNENDPNYLGRILFDENGHWIYDGDQLSIIEQEQLGEFISGYEDVDY